ncbi:helix-turn-helix transcriptional regulator [Nocardia terpenica]|uniref:DUF1870 family protein n=1 Tax=Nocardia terpenica TaxID=455432 RepID=UPI001893CFF1|nr:DUF1870 family protein [Nocardia terpenica]MBF6063000.1 helix-turn-helix transcriptional regulator [Nocardia terpenica]MBF6104865.1 helix-turn-helix transcriptional regulator [Nocardia terpenica]MBF6112698.1 helix-turn-helix transcriptional regulator [Nocardia terpenica]MBF6118593.1 helix-turn-helix transcriptional regulator [Nocardia terpenica]MBF6155072.1 helix-turn-helix transcriptional regulator [Nocardia terpenica]
MGDTSANRGAAWYRATRKLLGLNDRQWWAEYIGVSSSVVDQWERGKQAIPAHRIEQLAEISAQVLDLIDTTIAAIDAGERGLVLVTYRTNHDYRVAEPGSVFPAAWHEAWTARVVAERPEVELRWAEPASPE